MAFETFILHGREESPDGTPHSGRVFVTPSAVIREVGGGVVMSGTVSIDLDTTGAWTVTLPCTDDPGLLPAGHRYLLTFRLPGASRTVISGIAAPPGTGSIDAGTLATDIAPAPSAAPAAAAADLAALKSQVDGLTTVAYDTDGIPYLV